MKAKPTYDEKVLQNEDKFTDPFYRRFKMKPFTLKLDDKISKTYQFPTLLGDVTCAIAIFLCSMRGAKKFMPHPKMLPVKMTGGKSLVIFSCYEYKNVLGVAPYNEIAMTIPVMVNPSFNVPILPMLMDKAFKEFGYYVFSMPVTSLENQLRGLKIWGLPKVVQDIDMYEEDGFNICRAYEESGEKYFELHVPTSGEDKHFDVNFSLYSRLGDKLLQSKTCLKATFKVNMNFKQLFVKKKPDRQFLTLSNTPSGGWLRQLEIEDNAFQFRFVKGMTACFDLPNESYKAPFSFK